jgi:hypothetical protein
MEQTMSDCLSLFQTRKSVTAYNDRDMTKYS